MRRAALGLLYVLLVFAATPYAIAQDNDAQRAQDEAHATDETIEDEVIVVTATRRGVTGSEVSLVVAINGFDLLPIGIPAEENPVEYSNQSEYLEAVQAVLPMYLSEPLKTDRFCYRRTEKRRAVRKALKRCAWLGNRRCAKFPDIFVSKAGDKISIRQSYGTGGSFGSNAFLYARTADTGAWQFVDAISETYFE